MLLTLATLAVFAPQGPGTSTAPVVINEFSYEDAGTDDKEFVELYNRTAVPVDISGWSLQGEEGTLGDTPNAAFVFPANTFINPGDHLVVGMAGVPGATFVTDTSTYPEWMGEVVGGSANLPDGMTLRNAAGTVIDGVVWNYAVWTSPAPTWLEGDGLNGAYVLFDGTATPPNSMLTMQRIADGYDDDDNGHDFVQLIWTPGLPNGVNNVQAPVISESCDAPVSSTLAALFSYSFVPPTLYDPAAVTVAGTTVRAFPPSPQGGNIARIQDPTGGGNMVVSQTVLFDDMLTECYVYITPGNAALLSGEGESWSFGMRGTTDSYGHPVDVPGTYYAQSSLCATSRSPGATGVAWMAYVSSTGTDVYLVDINDGGPGFTVLAGPITCTTGVNDGWQRLRLRTVGNQLIANFGGTLGADNGQRFTATITPTTGLVYFQYRECIIANANMTGLMFDQFELWSAVNAMATVQGTGSPTNFGQPAISTSGGLPILGSSTFRIDASGMIPNGIGLLAVDLGVLLPGIPIPGAQPGLLLYAAPTVIGTVGNTAGGTASQLFPLPPINALVGTPLAAQFFDLDLTLPYGLPFGSSPGLQITVGNG